MLSLRPPRGPLPVGALTFVAPVSPPIHVGTATFAATAAPALVLDEIAFTAYYPADLARKPRRGLDWLVRPAGATLRGYAHFLSVPAWMLWLAWPVVYLFGAALKIPAHRNAPLLHPDARKQWPLVILSHGLAGSRTTYSQLCLELAAAGKVVLAIEHRDGTGPACFPHGRTMMYTREDEVVFPPETEEGDAPRVLPLRADQLVFRQHEVYRTYAAFCALVRDGVALDTVGGERVDLKSWSPEAGLALVKCDDVSLVGHSFGGCTMLSMLSSAPPSNAYPPIPMSKVLLYDPWLEPIPSPGPTPTATLAEPSNSEVALPDSIIKPSGQQAQGELLVINSQTFTLWTDHFKRLVDIVHAWQPQGRRLLTLIGSQHSSFSDLPVLPLIRTKDGTTLMDLTATLSLAFLDGTFDAALERVPIKEMEIKIIGKRKDGRPKRTLVGEVGDVVVH
ncbi:platelet-activating factor acetylhydrolase, isoform II-domain-containing protein [Mycena vitilis]|nr:platelet-activating factor acetylhydrolase, isoform II-domain-containing protein [Mycena vitilis]